MMELEMEMEMVRTGTATLLQTPGSVDRSATHPKIPLGYPYLYR